jgi:hypothetical protein
MATQGVMRVKTVVYSDFSAARCAFPRKDQEPTVNCNLEQAKSHLRFLATPEKLCRIL